MTLYIIIAFLVGSTLGAVLAMFLFGCFHSRQREDWQAEYLRLMGGIGEARDGLGAWVEKRTGLKDQKDPISIKKDLDKLFYDEPIWPRK